MNYRWYAMREERVMVARETALFEIHTLPARGQWRENWGGSYTESEIWADIRQDLRHILARFGLWVARTCGVPIRKGVPEYTVQHNWVEVDTTRLLDAIMAKLTEYERRRLADNCMILCGPDVLAELSNIQSPFSFQGSLRLVEYRTDHRGRLEPIVRIFGVPVVCLNDFKGVAVIPDMTKVQPIR